MAAQDYRIRFLWQISKRGVDIMHNLIIVLSFIGLVIAPAVVAARPLADE